MCRPTRKRHIVTPEGLVSHCGTSSAVQYRKVSMMRDDHIPMAEWVPPSGQEQWQSPSVAVVLPIQAHHADGSSLVGEVVSLSLGGMTFRAESWIEPGTACRAEITLPDRGLQVVCSFHASVLWCEAGSAPECYWVGCSIVDLPFSSMVWLKQSLSG